MPLTVHHFSIYITVGHVRGSSEGFVERSRIYGAGTRPFDHLIWTTSATSLDDKLLRGFTVPYESFSCVSF